MLTVSKIVISIDILDSRASILDTLWINNDLPSHAYLIVKIFYYCTFDIITETVWFLLTLTVPLVLILRSSIVHWRCIWHFWSATYIFHQLGIVYILKFKFLQTLEISTFNYYQDGKPIEI